MDLSLAVFACVYAVMLLGSVPGLRLDRTGAALLGAIVLVAGGALTSTAAWQAIDIGTIGLLLGLMIVSAQFRLGGFYTRLTRWLAARPTSPERLLLELVVTVGALSALLTNDVVCLAIAPVLVDVCCRRRLDPVPFLLALAAASNVGSAATLIGNPQNMLIGQSLHLSFGGYLLDGAVPAALGLFVVWAVIARAHRHGFARDLAVVHAGDQPFDRWQTGKGLAVLALLVTGLLAGALPREVQALLAGGVLLLSRRLATREMLALVDWQLLVLFGGLFVVNHAFQAAGHAAAGFAALRQHGLDVAEPGVLFATSVVGSNLISNVPLTMLLLPVAEHPLAGPILALATTLAGNLLLVGSIANLIVVEQANRLGVRPQRSSWVVAHLRTGVPITLLTLALAAGWLWLRA
ncbi:MAG TPA: SLC13 family permease [Planctomycetota bacterium]|nr:SLC13 family permease [Planctomycetota bacterium]